MQLSTGKKVMATGAALLGVVLGAAGISAAATGTGGSTHEAPAAAHAQQSGTATDTPEANDVPDAPDGKDTVDVPDKADAPDKADGAEHEDAGTDVGETDGQG
jgi:hypothetical protein